MTMMMADCSNDGDEDECNALVFSKGGVFMFMPSVRYASDQEKCTTLMMIVVMIKLVKMLPIQRCRTEGYIM